MIGEDCSTDGTREIVRALRASAIPELVRAVLPERNVGHGEILRRALEATSGELIAYLDGDDYWTSPRKLRAPGRVPRGEPRLPRAASTTSASSTTRPACPSGTVSPGSAEERFGLEQIVMECFVPAPAMMFRREVVDELAGLGVRARPGSTG